MTRYLLALAFTALLLVTARGATVYVAPTGSDSDPGTLEKPFATIQHAQSVVGPGDTVYLRGGTYTMTEKQIAQKRRIWAYVTFLDKSGTKDQRINYWAYKDERPVFDYSKVKPNLRVHAFQVNASWIHLRGIEVIGVQVTIKRHTQSIGFANDGSHNIYERLSIHDGMAIGIYSVNGSDNLFLNCDAYRNHDPVSEDGKGGNVDGFGGHPTAGSTGNIFRGCRAWFNSDDGYDCIMAQESVTFENCWAMYNGYSPTFEKLADGNGFKAGGYAATAADRLPKPIPRHVVQFCLAVRNKASGFYANHHPGGCDWFHNSAYRNGTNFNMLGRLPDNRTDIDGIGHKLWNNLSYKGGKELAKIDAAKCDAMNNSFTLDLKISDADFASVDMEELIRPRQPNGDLPAIKFLHHVEGGPLIGKGVERDGSKSELGAFRK